MKLAPTQFDYLDKETKGSKDFQKTFDFQYCVVHTADAASKHMALIRAGSCHLLMKVISVAASIRCSSSRA